MATCGGVEVMTGGRFAAAAATTTVKVWVAMPALAVARPGRRRRAGRPGRRRASTGSGRSSASMVMPAGDGGQANVSGSPSGSVGPDGVGVGLADAAVVGGVEEIAGGRLTAADGDGEALGGERRPGRRRRGRPRSRAPTWSAVGVQRRVPQGRVDRHARPARCRGSRPAGRRRGRRPAGRRRRPGRRWPPAAASR